MSKHAFPSRSFSAIVPSIVARGDGSRSPLDSIKAGGSRISRMTRATGLSKRTMAEPSDINPETRYVDPLNQALTADMKDADRCVRHFHKSQQAERARIAAVASRSALPTLRKASGAIVQTWQEKCKAQRRDIEPAKTTRVPSLYDARKLSQVGHAQSGDGLRIALARRASELRAFRLAHKARE